MDGCHSNVRRDLARDRRLRVQFDLTYDVLVDGALQDLQRLARSLGVDDSGHRGQVAVRIARWYKRNPPPKRPSP